MDKERNQKNNKKDKELTDSLHPDTHKGPQKPEHTNQYGDQDEATRVQ
ncbi:MAG: hypothetical protein R3359_02895 [Marinirhabdus sp.]|nr:hypothetical protein [Marinirhabdus sp.]